MTGRQLTRREHWLLWKRRRGLTQREAALAFRVGEWTVVQWDKGIGKDIPKRKASPPYTPGERCWLARKLSGAGLFTIARDLKVSRVTVLNWEHDIGDVSRLMAYWSLL